MLKATTRAIPQLRKALGDHRALFFGAKGGGCSGFQYFMEPTNRDDATGMDELISVGGVPMVVCGKSMFLIMYTEIDWVEDTMGARFVFDNPNATGGCGCGATFSA